MNIKTLLLCMGLLLSSELHAQNSLKIGLHTGLNYPDIRGHEYAKYNNFKMGYLIGVSFDHPLINHLSLKANLNYERKIKALKLTYYNWEFEKAGTEDFKETYEYLNFPVLLKYEFGNTGIFANAGPFFNLLLNDEIKPDYPNELTDGLTDQKKIDFGLSGGIGIDIALDERNALTIEIRDDFGVIDTGGVPEQIKGTVKTNMVKLMVGWNIGL